MKEFLKKYGHCWTASYFILYMIWFTYLENRSMPSYHVMHCFVDDYIPFVDIFIIPYIIWFLYIPAAWLFLFFKDKKEFYKFCLYLYLGMSICLFICTIFPNGQDLRVNLDFGENVWVKMLSFIYNSDSNTNVFPSIHVFNSIAIHLALMKSKHIPKGHWVTMISLSIMLLICSSTVFLKQHSILDVLAGTALAVVLYFFIYDNLLEKIKDVFSKKISDKYSENG